MSHVKVVCKICQTRLGGCKCFDDCNPRIEYGICTTCADLGFNLLNAENANVDIKKILNSLKELRREYFEVGKASGNLFIAGYVSALDRVIAMFD